MAKIEENKQSAKINLDLVGNFNGSNLISKALETIVEKVDGVDLSQYTLDLEQEIPEPDCLLSISGTRTIPRGELVGIKGRPKCGKSQFAFFTEAAFMRDGRDIGPIRALHPGLKVVHADTEQSLASLATCARRALRTIGMPVNKNADRLTYLHLRNSTPQERRDIISQAVEAHHPDVLIIDGIRDLLTDFNDLSESADLIEWLLSLSSKYNLTIISVLHQNQSTQDGKMRGHLGSELLNKLYDCFEVSVADRRFKVKHTDSRGVTAPEISFAIGGEGGGQFVFLADTETADIVAKCFAGATEGLSNSALLARYMTATGKSEPSFNRDLRKWVDQHLVTKGGRGRETRYFLGASLDFQ